MSNTFHILHIVASLQGGAAVHVKHLTHELTLRGHQISIAAPNDNPELALTFEQDNIAFHDIPLANAWIIKAIRRLTPLLKNATYTHIHVHGHRAALITRLARLFSFSKIPLIYTVHGYHPPHYPSKFSRFYVNALEAMLLFQTDKIICVSPTCRESLLEHLPAAKKKCHVIPNGIPSQSHTKDENQQLRKNWRNKFDIPQDAWVAGTVARLQWQKGIDRLLKAWSMFKPSHPAYLLIIGDGPDRARLMKESEHLGIAAHCIFAGNQSHPRELYHSMDVFVLPSLWEGLPLTILEAWDAEIPVIATDVPGNRDLIIDGETGYLAQPIPEGIHDTLIRVYESSNKTPAITQTAKNEFITHYTLDRMTREMEEIYRRLK